MNLEHQSRRLRAGLVSGIVVATVVLISSMPGVMADGNITGVVTDQDGNVLEGYTITITNNNNAEWDTATTDEDGVFSMSTTSIGANPGDSRACT